MINKIAIVGGADSKKSAPFMDSSWEIWTCNNIYKSLPRIDRLFEIHKISYQNDDWYRRGRKEFRGMIVGDYLKEISELSTPVYMQKIWSIIPQSIEYPIDIITKIFGRYFTSTPAYMIALAIFNEVKEISLYGINMGLDPEYSKQKPCIEYLLGWARGAGIKISITENSMFLDDPQLYGYDEIIFPEEIYKLNKN